MTAWTASLSNGLDAGTIHFIRRFMVTFSLLSSVFDYFTFFVLLAVLGAGPEEFRTGWLIESVISASLIVLVIRSRRPFFQSQPSRYLLWATGLVVITTLFLPFIVPARLLGFQPLPLGFLLMLGGIVAFYIAAAEVVKRCFYKKWSAN
jgi:Mg2+-importing ATPase